MTPRVRFAPSPTGFLHLGNARAALVNWLFARHHGGSFLLRLDDTDRERSREKFVAAIEADLRWLGLGWDERARQSERLAHYAAAAEALRAGGRLYPCYETETELALKRRAQQAQGLPPRYDRAALALSAEDRHALEAAGHKPHWRFRLRDGEVHWDDLVQGGKTFQAQHLSDPVLVRHDGLPLYTLSSVVDDLAFGITHVIRGEDHVSNTAVQIQITQALGGAVPTYAHLPLLIDAEGKGLSKRLGSLSLGELKAQGLEPMALASYLAKLGTADAIQLRGRLDDLAAELDLVRFNRAQPRLDEQELWQLNARHVHGLPFEAVAARVSGLDAALWEAVRGNLVRVEEAAEWLLVRDGPLAPVIEDAAFCAEAAALLPAEPYDAGTWRQWTATVQAATGRKGRALFHPLRLALTARESGPEMAALLPLIGRVKAERRLKGEKA